MCICQKKPPKIEVLMSNAGFYIGQFCQQCGPCSRMSGYYKTREAAEEDLPAYVE